MNLSHVQEIFHPETPNYYVEIRGIASIEPDQQYRFADRLGARWGVVLHTCLIVTCLIGEARN